MKKKKFQPQFSYVSFPRF